VAAWPRRGALSLLAGGAAMASMLGLANRRPLSVVVIGAGTMGVSIAYHLAKRGAQVAVLDRSAPGGGATQGAFAMLIATHDGDRAFNDLYGLAVGDWRRLQRELPALQIQWGGTCSWAAPGPAADAIAASTSRLRDWGASIRPMNAGDLERLVPGVAPGPFGAGAFSPEQGTLDPSQAHAALLAAANRLGVRVRTPCEAQGFDVAGGTIRSVRTASGDIRADMFVLAAGVDSPPLAGPLGVKTPIDVVSGTLAHSAPHPRALQRVLNGPAGSLKQDPDRRIVIGPDYRPGANGTDISPAYGEQLLVSASKVLPALEGARLERMTLGFVAIPKDSHPIVGFCAEPSNLYVAVTMSGITMAPLMGRFAANEIVGGLSVDRLAAYRPSRFA